MKKSQLDKQRIRKKRSMRVRKKLRGNEEKPRLCVIKSNHHIHAQLIDDVNGLTLGSFATLSKDFKEKKSKESAKKIGEKIAEIAKEKNIKEMIFDRGRFMYHGIMVELADAIREAGVKI